MANSADLDQLVSEEANLSGSTLSANMFSTTRVKGMDPLSREITFHGNI